MSVQVCSICVEPTNLINSIIKCNKCCNECCKKCFKKYITDSNHYFKCMGVNIINDKIVPCNIEYDIYSLFKYLGITFIKKEYKKIKEEILFEYQRSLFNISQLSIEKEKEIDKINQEIENVKIKYENIRNENIKKLTSFTLSNKVLPTRQAIEQYIILYNDTLVDEKIQYEISKLYNRIDELKNNKDTFKTIFIKKCPNNNCNGLLNNKNIDSDNNYLCTLCNSIICKDCNEIIKINNKIINFNNANNKSNNLHKCDENTLKTIEYITHSSKPCPVCSSSIHKINGCYGKGTIISLHNGINKNISELIIGDELTGDDSSPKKIIALFSGIDQLYVVNQEFGKSYIVNSKHNLALMTSQDNKLNVNVETFLNFPHNIKQTLKGYNINGKKSKLDIIPYKKGVYYGFELEGNHKFLDSDGTVLMNCNEMFCTNCNSSFDWKTLKIINNRALHNPHYFEWIQDRNPLDIRCGEELNDHMISDLCDYIKYIISKKYNKNYQKFSNNDLLCKKLENFYNICNLALKSNSYITEYQSYNPNPLLALKRIKFLKKEINIDQFKKSIIAADKKQTIFHNLINILIMFRDCSAAIVFRFYNIYTNSKEVKVNRDFNKEELEIIKHIDELEELNKYILQILNDLDKIYTSQYILDQIDCFSFDIMT